MKQPEDGSGGGRRPNAAQSKLRELRKGMRVFLRESVLSSDMDFETFVDRFAVMAARWTPHNWALVLSQRPDMQAPMTLKEVKALGREVRAGVRPAAILVPIQIEDEAAEPAEDDEGKKERGAGHFFIAKACVVDGLTDVEGDEPIVLPLVPSAVTADARLALLERVTGMEPDEVDTGSVTLRAHAAAEAIALEQFEDYTLPRRAGSEENERLVADEDARYARIRVTMHLVLQAFGLPRPPLKKADIEKGWSGPRSFLQVLADAALPMREVIAAARHELQESAEEWPDEVRRSFETIADRCVRAVTKQTDAMVEVSPNTEEAAPTLVPVPVHRPGRPRAGHP